MTELLIRRRKGMTSVKEMPVLQDGPPPGGFPAIRYARRIPNSGPGGVVIFLVASSVVSYGLYQVGQGNRKRRAYKQEKFEARKAILPFIQAEEDARFVREKQKYLEEEARIMANVPGWKVGESVYHTKKWRPPAARRIYADYQ
ncbi:hypothetical protein KP509_19G044600 [Ceratopteris richardii]|uniref:NADH dehydrogenase [ubiquinone] 1 alpha subcomplex subunit 13 n=1 Tax=Ceratopteris richardii TaxID=49495 RepID=A0A8T2SK99_CERRI|nr:hypothetical protein KP509_19G044600 [Ceratopteris richardii]